MSREHGDSFTLFVLDDFQLQSTLALRASMTDQHHAVEEPAGLLHEGIDRLGHLTGQLSDVHRPALPIRWMLMSPEQAALRSQA